MVIWDWLVRETSANHLIPTEPSPIGWRPINGDVLMGHRRMTYELNHDVPRLPAKADHNNVLIKKYRLYFLCTIWGIRPRELKQYFIDKNIHTYKFSYLWNELMYFIQSDLLSTLLNRQYNLKLLNLNKIFLIWSVNCWRGKSLLILIICICMYAYTQAKRQAGSKLKLCFF